MKEIIVEIGLKERVSEIYFQLHIFFKGSVKIVKIYKLKFNVTILNRP